MEITKLCAEAMGYRWAAEFHGEREGTVTLETGPYDPFHYKTQALDLVTELGLNITHFYWGDPLVEKIDAHHNEIASARNADLIRAIVECVAKMQRANAGLVESMKKGIEE